METVINPKGSYLYIWGTQDATLNPVYSWYKAGPRQRTIAANGDSTDITINLFGVTLTGTKTYAWSQVHYDVDGVQKTGYVREGDYEISAVQTDPTKTGTDTTPGTLNAGFGWIGAGLLALLFLGSMGGKKKGKRKK